MTGIICLWSGAIVDIPEGWSLCDGQNGTPDLRDRFVIGAGNTYAPHDTGGKIAHLHSMDLGGHYHWMPGGTIILNSSPDGNYKAITSTNYVSGVTYEATLLPPYYALAFIMKT